MIVDLFAGIGWGCALEQLGLTECGYDLDTDVCATRALHGWPTVQCDLATFEPADMGDVDVMIASPPCQDFSMAGKRAMLESSRGKLVWEPLRYALALRPRILVCEQVAAVLPIWRATGTELAHEGYSWWAGNLSAETFGVPQTRKRAILVARRDGRSPLPPAPTHRAYRSGVPREVGDPSLLPWVSMAEALGWGMTERPGMTFAPGTEAGGPDIAGGSGARRTIAAERESGRWRLLANDQNRTLATGTTTSLRQRSSPARSTVHGSSISARPAPEGVYGRDNITRPIDAPSPVFGTKSGGQWVLRERQTNGATRPDDTPAPTITSSADNGNFQWHARPATTITGDDRVALPGHHHPAEGHSSQYGPDPIRLTVEQALVLQSFPPDFALAGTKTAQFRQIGNAVAPLFARALLAHVLNVAPAEVAA